MSMTRHFKRFSVEIGRAPNFGLAFHWDYQYYEIIVPFFSISFELGRTLER